MTSVSLLVSKRGDDNLDTVFDLSVVARISVDYDSSILKLISNSNNELVKLLPNQIRKFMEYFQPNSLNYSKYLYPLTSCELSLLIVGLRYFFSFDDMYNTIYNSYYDNYSDNYSPNNNKQLTIPKAYLNISPNKLYKYLLLMFIYLVSQL